MQHIILGVLGLGNFFGKVVLVSTLYIDNLLNKQLFLFLISLHKNVFLSAAHIATIRSQNKKIGYTMI
jgi:hypothetical protein